MHFGRRYEGRVGYSAEGGAEGGIGCVELRLAPLRSAEPSLRYGYEPTSFSWVRVPALDVDH